MRIDVMHPEDWTFVSNIYNQAIEKGGASVLSHCPTYPEWDAKHHADLRFVMREEDKVIGWCALSPFSDRYAYRGVAEVSVYVDDSHQGKGIGKALLMHTIAKSEEKGIWTLFSKTFSSNIASIKLQVSCGFHIVGIHEKLGHDRWGTFQDITVLERRSRQIQWNE